MKFTVEKKSGTTYLEEKKRRKKGERLPSMYTNEEESKASITGSKRRKAKTVGSNFTDGIDHFNEVSSPSISSQGGGETGCNGDCGASGGAL